MENIGDLIFYILAAVFVLFGAFGKKKKRVPAPLLQPVERDDYEKDLSVKEAAEKARARPLETISSEDFSWSEEITKREPVHSDGEWVEPMAAKFSQEGISAFAQEGKSFKDGEKSIYDLDIEEISDPDAEKKKEAREQSRVNAIANRFNLAEAIVFSEILARRDNF